MLVCVAGRSSEGWRSVAGGGRQESGGADTRQVTEF